LNNAVAVTRKLFTVGEYDQMIKAGIFHEDERLELVAGEIIEMSPINVRHQRSRPRSVR
jgi:Uma2 family endonuclease